MEILNITSKIVSSPSVKAPNACPAATTDIAVNLKNRQKAIDTAGYGPLNPKEPNNEFWREKGERWDVTRAEARKQTCGNCAAFSKTKEMLDCINEGLSAGSKSDSWDVINAGDLGYCEAFDFKCASSRTCDAWVVGGPIEDSSQQNEEKGLDLDASDWSSLKEKQVSEYLDSLTDDEFKILFPDDEEMTDAEAKWIFDVAGAYARRALTGRRKRRKKRRWKEDSAETETKGASKEKLRDPKGGLTAAGRKHFNAKEGSNLRPGVKGPADTPMKMRRKGSFLVRFFTNPRGPMVDEKGRPTRLALSAAAWGEPVPRNMESAKKLAQKGQRLLEKYRKYQESQKKKSDSEEIEFKELGSTIGQRNNTVGSSSNSGSGKKNGPKKGNYDENARDADGDGTVQEGTDYARPVEDKKKDKKKTPFKSPTSKWKGNQPNKPFHSPIKNNKNKNQRTGTADSSERIAENEEMKRTGKGKGFDKISTPEEMEAYRRSQGLPPKRKPSQSRTGTADSAERRNTAPKPKSNTGKVRPSADAQERAAIDEFLTSRDFDKNKEFTEWAKSEIEKLKPGQKTNWNPGRLPNGGRIAADGTYIPPDAVRRDDKTRADNFRKNRPKPTTARTGTAGSAERNAEKNTPKAKPDNKPFRSPTEKWKGNKPGKPFQSPTGKWKGNKPGKPFQSPTPKWKGNKPGKPFQGPLDA